MTAPLCSLKIELFADGRIGVLRDGVDNQLVFLGLLETAKDILKKAYQEQSSIIQPVKRAA